jgi:hypothetical protein
VRQEAIVLALAVLLGFFVAPSPACYCSPGWCGLRRSLCVLDFFRQLLQA